MRIFLFTIIFFNGSFGLKILQFVPGYSNSHVLLNYRLAAALKAEGHEITLWSNVIPALVKSTLKPPSGVAEIRFNISGDISGITAFQKVAFRKNNLWDLIKIGQSFRKTFKQACAQQMDLPMEVIRPLKSKNFDLAITYYIDFCPGAVTYILGIEKQVWLSPGIYIFDIAAQLLGIPQNPSYIPNALSAFSDQMTFMERVKNFSAYVFMTLFYFKFPNVLSDINKEFRAPPNDDRPDIFDLRVQSLMINGDQLLDFPRPLPYGFTFTGELRPRENRKRSQTAPKLAEAWQGIVDNSEKGIVIFSLGTVANTSEMPVEMKVSWR